MINIDFNKINTSSVEGKLIVAAIGMLSDTSKTPDDALKDICEMANKIYYEDEINLRDDLRNLITERINSLYYKPEQTKAGSASGVPDVVATKINDSIDSLFLSLKEAGLFSE
jgi:hypothetical protein